MAVITSEDKVDALIEEYPELNRFLMERGIFCMQCGEVYWGKIGDLIRSKGGDVESILSEINARFK